MNKSQILVDILNKNQINSVGKILQENNVDYEVENGHIRVGSTVLDEQDLDSLIYSRVMDMKEDYDLLYANDNSYLQKFSKEENLIDKRIEILEKGFEKIKIETELDDKSNYKKSVKFQKEFEEKYNIKISENTFWYFEKKQDDKEVKEIQEDKKEIIKEKDDKEMEF